MFLEFLGSPHVYIFIFVGLLVGGEVVLLPSTFFALLGYLNIWYIFTISVIAVTIADTLWYLFGRRLTKERVVNLPIFRKRRELLFKTSAAFEKYSFLVIFFAKYIYGIRIIVQILSGIHRVPFWRYFSTNVSAIILLNLVLIALASTITTSLRQLEDVTRAISLGLTAFVIIVILLHWLAGRIITRRKEWIAT